MTLKASGLKCSPDIRFNMSMSVLLYRNVYRTELLQAKLLSIFTLIALFICSMGLAWTVAVDSPAPHKGNRIYVK